MTPDDVRAAAEQLVDFHERFAPLFGKEQAQDHAYDYLKGLMTCMMETIPGDLLHPGAQGRWRSRGRRQSEGRGDDLLHQQAKEGRFDRLTSCIGDCANSRSRAGPRAGGQL
jgi:hypothetical protein